MMSEDTFCLAVLTRALPEARLGYHHRNGEKRIAGPLIDRQYAMDRSLYPAYQYGRRAEESLISPAGQTSTSHAHHGCTQRDLTVAMVPSENSEKYPSLDRDETLSEFDVGVRGVSDELGHWRARLRNSATVGLAKVDLSQSG